MPLEKEMLEELKKIGEATDSIYSLMPREVDVTGIENRLDEVIELLRRIARQNG